MKAILEFNLPDEKNEFNSALKGSAALIALWRLKEIFYKKDEDEKYITPEEFNSILEDMGIIEEDML